MEKENLNELSSLLTEEIYFLPEEFNEAPQEEKEENRPAPSISSVEEPKIKSLKTGKTEDLKPEPIKVRGDFSQQVLVLHEESELTEDALELLSKILGAVNHSMSDIGLLSSEELEGRSLEDFKEIGAHKIIRFGRIKHPINAIPAPEYQVHSDEETEFLFADALTVIKDDNSLKRKLWGALQVLFHVTK